MRKKAVLLALSAKLVFGERRLLDADDPLQGASWSTNVINLCESIPFGTGPAFPWRSEVKDCSDEPSLALCYLARQISGLNSCEDAAEQFKLCHAFPDAMTNYCCVTASGLPGCVGDDQDSPPISSEGRPVDMLPGDHPTARPFLPTSIVRRLSELDLSAALMKKNLVISFPNDMSPCNLLASSWKLFRMMALFLDLEHLLDIMPATAALREDFELRVSHVVEKFLTVGGFEYINSMLKNESNPVQDAVSAPFYSFSKAISEAPLQNFTSSLAPASTVFNEQSLASCATLPNFVGKLMGMIASWVGGDMEAAQFRVELSKLIDSHFIVIDGGKAGLEKQELQKAPILSFRMPAFTVIPACNRAAANLNIRLDNAELDLAKLIAKGKPSLRQIQQQLRQCNSCFEKFWVKVTQEASQEDFNEKDALREGGRLKLVILSWLDRLVQAVDDDAKRTRPLTVGLVIETLMEKAQEAGRDRGLTMTSVMESAFLLLQAIQKDKPGPKSITDTIQDFLSRSLDCPTASTQTRRVLLEEVGDDKMKNRELQPKRKQREPGLDGAEVRFSQESPDAIAGRGNLISSEESSGGAGVSIVGYQCRDSLPFLFSDYLSLWVERGSCAALIETFGCLAQRGRWKAVLPFQVLLHSCPASWISLCQAQTLPKRLTSQLRMMAGEEADETTEEEALQEAFWTRMENPAGSYDPTEENLQIETLLSQLPRSPAFEPFQMCIGSQIRRIDTAEESTTTTTPLTTCPKPGKKSKAFPSVDPSFLFIILLAFAV